MEDLKQSDIQVLNKFQHFVVKDVQGLKFSTTSDMCESMLGSNPIISKIDKNNFFLYFIYTNRRPFFRFLKGLGLYEILNKYNLLQHLRTFIEKSLFPRPGRNEWKSVVKQAILHHQIEEMEDPNTS